MKTYKFSNRNLAQSFAYRTDNLVIFHGDDGKFWVVTPAQAAKLERQGYEWVR